jgi:glyoxylase-like metal-dependent hydrolase (beta-lactamase superfamily II)
MYIKCFPSGIFGSNCYIIGNEGTGAVIDAGVRGTYIKEEADRLGLAIKYIILTHAHMDHIAYADELKEMFGAKVFIHQADYTLMGDPSYNASVLFGKPKTYSSADVLLKDGDILDLNGMKLEVIHTPGHTPGGVCIKAGDCIFTGDTLFEMSIGRTDFSGGNYGEMINSIKEKLLKLDDNMTVYPGHGPSTTIGCERRYNPYINGEMHN